MKQKRKIKGNSSWVWVAYVFPTGLWIKTWWCHHGIFWGGAQSSIFVVFLQLFLEALPTPVSGAILGWNKGVLFSVRVWPRMCCLTWRKADFLSISPVFAGAVQWGPHAHPAKPRWPLSALPLEGVAGGCPAPTCTCLHRDPLPAHTPLLTCFLGGRAE